MREMEKEPFGSPFYRGCRLQEAGPDPAEAAYPPFAFSLLSQALVEGSAAI